MTLKPSQKAGVKLAADAASAVLDDLQARAEHAHAERRYTDEVNLRTEYTGAYKVLKAIQELQ